MNRGNLGDLGSNGGNGGGALPGALDHAPCGFVRVNDAGEVLQANATLHSMLGRAAGTINGRDISSILTAAACVLYQTRLFPLLRLQGRVDEIYLSMRARNGETVPVLVNAVRHGPDDAGVSDCIVVRMKQRGDYEGALLAATRESKRVAAELRASQHFLQRVADVVPGVIQVFDVQQRRSVFVNRNVATLLGHSQEAIAAMGTDVVRELMHPDDIRLFVAQMKLVRLLSDDETSDVEYRMRHRAGNWRWLHSRLAIFSRNDAGVKEIISTSIDITSRKLAEDAVRASEEQFRVLTTAMPQLVWSCSSAGECIFQAPQWAAVTGQSVADSLGFGWTAKIHPDDRARTTDAWQRAVAGDTGYRAEYRLLTRDGGQRWFLARAEALRDAGGGVLRWIGTSTDIDDTKRLEIKLRESEERMRLATEATGVGIWEWDVRTDRVHWDAQMFRIYGVDPTDDGFVAYRDWLAAVLPEQLPGHERALQDTLRQLGKGSRTFRIIRRSDGQCRDIQSVETVRLNAAGQAECVVGTNLDITERARMEADLRDADRRKDEFVATLAHELRGPLAPISNCVELLRRRAGDAAIVERAGSIMDRQVAHIVRLVDDLLDISRITRNKLELKAERIDLASVVAQAVEASRPLFEQARQRLAIDLPLQPVALHADPVRLVQVLGNLLTNASKYSDADSQVWLSAERQGGVAVLSVRDSGIGIAPEMLDKVFEMFTQVEAPAGRTQTGLGIGLSLAKRLVEQHGGTLSAHSDGLGQGSCFVVRLPIPPLTARPAPTRPAAALRADTLALRVLVVDDNRDGALTLVDFLDMLGHATAVAHDGRQALDRAAAFRPDVILLDLGLPEMTGYDACRLIRRQAWGQHTLIIALTGWGQDEDRRKSREAGFDAHLVKPVDVDVLTDLLAQPRVPRD